MEKPIKIFSVLFAVLVMLTQCASYRPSYSCALLHKNFTHEIMLVPDELLTADSQVFSPATLFTYESPWLYEEGVPVSDTVAKALSILKLTLYWYTDEKYDTQFFDTNYAKLYYLGKIKLSDNFDSFLIRVESASERSKGKELYLMNAKGNTILSIVCVSYYGLVEINSFCIWTVAKHHDAYLQKSKTLTSDVIEPWYYRKNKVTKGHRFKIDSNGYIVVCE